MRASIGYGIGLFLCCLCLHVALWRRFRPRRHLTALLAVFGGPWLAVSAALLLGCPAGCGCGLCATWAAASLLHVALSCAYIQTYPAAQAQSPTLKMLLLVRSAIPEGSTDEQLLRGMDQRAMLHDRIRDLMEAGLLKEHPGGRLSLAAHGVLMIAPFAALRRILGLERGKG